jgi:hypothetical protein
MEIARPTHPQCSHFLSLNRCSHLVVDCLTFVSVWCTLEHSFASLSNSQIVQLHGFLQDLQQDDDTITLYLQKAKGLFDELATTSKLISPTDFNLYIFEAFVVNFMIWLQICQPKLSLFLTLSFIITCLHMSFYIGALFNPFRLLHHCCPHLRSLPLCRQKIQD